MDIVVVFILAIFILLVIANLILQFYVATLMRGGIGGIFFAFRGTKVFIQGWQQADHLGIKPIMTIWSWVLVLMIVFLCPTGIAGYFRNSSQNADSGERSSRPATAPPHVIRWEVTSPKPGDILHHSDGAVPILGFVDFDIQQVQKYQFWIRNGTQTAGLGIVHYDPMPESGSVLETITPSLYPLGEWEIALDIFLNDGTGRVFPEDNLKWIPITIAP